MFCTASYSFVYIPIASLAYGNNEPRDLSSCVAAAQRSLMDDDDDDDNYFRPVGPPEGYKDVLS